MKIFGIRVKEELKSQGKKQIDLARALNVKESTLSEWLNDHNEPPMETIRNIADYLGVSLDYLFGKED